MLSMSDAKLCSAELTCPQSFPTNGILTALDAEDLKLLQGGNAFILRDGRGSDDGQRTLTSEVSTTTWKKITHPLDGIDEPSPPDLLRITVRDNPSGQVVLSLH